VTTIRDWLTNPQLGLVPSVRESQVRMAEAVEKIFAEGGIAFIEAGTGTGKSVGYGLPSVLLDRRVVISTAKKGLQEQLIGKDLPHISRTVQNTAYAILMGKTNYVCDLRMEEFFGSNDVPEDAKDVIRNLEGGEIKEVNYPWLYNIRVNECVRAHCPNSGSCGYVDARARALNAKVLVVNHALLAHDLAMGGGKVLGKYDTLVIDEGHQAPGFFREAFSLSMNLHQPETISRLLKETDFEMGEQFTTAYHSLFANFSNRAGEFQITETISAILANIYVQAKKVHEAMVAKGLLGEEEGADFVPGSHGMARARAKLKAGGTILGRVRKLCAILLNLEGEEGVEDEWVRYTEKRGKDEMHLIVTPLEVGPLVAPALLGLKSVVVTSATLATANGMGFISREYGLAQSQITTQMVLPSPFNYAEQSALYVSRTAPDPAARGDTYYDKMCEEIHALLAASLGGAFVLCASNDDMNALHVGLYRKYHPMPYRLGIQNGASPESTVAWFKQDPKSVLIGLKTFWEGIDIPGDALRLVIIPRLPFPPRGDVVLNARKKGFIAKMVENEVEEKDASIRAWDAFDFQIAILDVKQGAGRLIRTATDKGVVAILDKRAQGRTKGYSHKVRGALPHPQTENKEGILQVLAHFAKLAGVSA